MSADLRRQAFLIVSRWRWWELFAGDMRGLIRECPQIAHGLACSFPSVWGKA